MDRAVPSLNSGSLTDGGLYLHCELLSQNFVADANYRFVQPNEVNARITQRQQALALYVTLVVSLLATLVKL